MTVVTRFAPSPTGYLHIGGARTALFNWLFARHHGGQFRLRIEDTDRERSTDEAVAAILDGLRWLELDWDGEVVHQFEGAGRHAEIARGLLEAGKAYHCYCSKEELVEMRERARAEGRPVRYDGRWRDRDPADAPAGVEPVVRFKAPSEGETVIDDGVQGSVRVANEQLDDMILLRANGTPTYMLSVVVDDHDMGVTDVIRGDDHLTNAARQSQLFLALGWELPKFAHIPLIHGTDGAKLSKRHGALAVGAYRDMGYLAEAMRNYLLRLGWAHGDEEIISTEQAVAWFDLGAVGRSPSRFDTDKLDNLNGHYLRQAEPARLVELIAPALAERLGHDLESSAMERLSAGMNGLRERAKNTIELSDNAYFYVARRPLKLDEKAARQLDEGGRERLQALRPALETLDKWEEPALEALVRAQAEAQDFKLGQLAQPLRAALTGSTRSPGIFDVMVVLGREESLARLDDTLG
jgi:glutamyl-tRNA synthetase